MNTLKIAEFLKKLRQQAGYTQAELGKIIEITDKAISRWESGNGFPEISNLLALSELYGITVDDILTCNENALGRVKHSQTIPQSACNGSEQSETKVGSLFDNVAGKFLAIIFFAYMSLGLYITSWQGADSAKFIACHIIFALLAIAAVVNEFLTMKSFAKVAAIVRVSVSGLLYINALVLMILQFAFAYSDDLTVPFASLATTLVFAAYVLYALHDFFEKRILKLTFALTATAVCIAITVYCAINAINIFFGSFYDDINLNIARGLIGVSCTSAAFAAAQLFGTKLYVIPAATAAATGIVCIALGFPLQDSPFMQSGPLPVSLWTGLATISTSLIILSFAFERMNGEYLAKRTLSVIAVCVCIPLVVNSFDILSINLLADEAAYIMHAFLRIVMTFTFMTYAIRIFDIGQIIQSVKRSRYETY